MKRFKFGPLSIDPAEYGSQGNAILGIRGSGKSYTATELGEKLHDNGVPWLAFDPTGIWRFIRVPGVGKGYPVVVAGGKHGDLPLTVAGTAALVRAAMESGVSIVFDLHGAQLSKADWRRVVTTAVRTLLQENAEHGLRHVFIEEAAEFVPQRPIDWDVYAEIEKMARIGGNARLGYTLINQRSQEVNKAVLELCENIFLHRQRGKNAIENLEKWLDVAGAEERQAIVKSMPDLPTGQCWAWLGGDEPQPPQLIVVPPKNSFHPDRRVMRGDAIKTKAKPVDVAEFVTGMKGQLEAIVEEAKANDPATLRKRIRELEAEVARKPAAGTVDAAAIEAAQQVGYQDGYRTGRMHAFGAADAALVQIREAGRRIGEAVAAFNTGLEEGFAKFRAAQDKPTFTPTPAITHRPAPYMPAPSTKVTVSTSTPAKASTAEGALKPALQRVVNAIGWWRQIGQDPVERSRACVVAGLSPKASTFGVYVAELLKLGVVVASPGRVGLSPKGVELAVVPAGNTREQIHDVARGLLGQQERRVFDAVYAAHPQEISRNDLAGIVGLSSTASTLGVYIAAIAGYGIIENGSRGHVRAASWLFP